STTNTVGSAVMSTSLRGGIERQGQSHRGARPRRAGTHRESALVQLDDAAADGQPHPHTLWFGGEEGLVQSFGRPGVKPGAGIVDGHLAHPVLGPRRVNADLPGILVRRADGVERVLQQIHENLLDLDTVDGDAKIRRSQLEPY